MEVVGARCGMPMQIHYTICQNLQGLIVGQSCKEKSCKVRLSIHNERKKNGIDSHGQARLHSEIACFLVTVTVAVAAAARC